MKSRKLTEIRRAAGDLGRAARWEDRGPSRTVRVDIDAAELLARVPERDRRRVASDAIREAVSRYFGQRPV